MHKSKSHFRKKHSRTRKNKCVYTDEAKRVMGLIRNLRKYKTNKTNKTNKTKTNTNKTNNNKKGIN